MDVRCCGVVRGCCCLEGMIAVGGLGFPVAGIIVGLCGCRAGLRRGKLGWDFDVPFLLLWTYVEIASRIGLC